MVAVACGLTSRCDLVLERSMNGEVKVRVLEVDSGIYLHLYKFRYLFSETYKNIDCSYGILIYKTYFHYLDNSPWRLVVVLSQPCSLQLKAVRPCNFPLKSSWVHWGNYIIFHVEPQHHTYHLVHLHWTPSIIHTVSATTRWETPPCLLRCLQ